MANGEKRTESFARKENLESLLADLNSNLESANRKYVENNAERFSKIFVVGPLRSGTTLFTQWLASTGLVAYPTNLLSRFYGAPLVGAKIQQLLTDPRYNFRNEILDFNSEVNFSSENGKTKGALAPNEFWYFWRRFLPFGELDYLPHDELEKTANFVEFRDELNALANTFEKPFAMKAMIMNQNIANLAEQFRKALFIWIRRDPVFNIQSALEARQRQFGDTQTWYSFKIKEYQELKDLEPVESVAGQIAAINSAIERDLHLIPDASKLIIDYEDFCRRPEYYYQQVFQKLIEQESITAIPPYNCETEFRNTNEWRLEDYSQEDVKKLYMKFLEKYSY